MLKKVLLLTQSYEFNSFVEPYRAIKLLIVDKVEPLSYWDDLFKFPSGSIQLPSIIRLKYPIKRMDYIGLTAFSRNNVIKRDNNVCQYCHRYLYGKEITIDHIIPKSQGGTNNFFNCVVSCYSCNRRKGNRTPEEAGMKLLKKPIRPTYSNLKWYENKVWHNDWNLYLE